jgi:hypothetical protein
MENVRQQQGDYYVQPSCHWQEDIEWIGCLLQTDWMEHLRLDAHEPISQFVREYGAPALLISNGAPEQTSVRRNSNYNITACS